MFLALKLHRKIYHGLINITKRDVYCASKNVGKIIISVYVWLIFHAQLFFFEVKASIVTLEFEIHLKITKYQGFFKVQDFSVLRFPKRTSFHRFAGSTKFPKIFGPIVVIYRIQECYLCWSLLVWCGVPADGAIFEKTAKGLYMLLQCESRGIHIKP